MKIGRMFFVVVIILAASLLTTHIVLAHQTITIGNYDVEYGWVNEPAVAGQPNAVVINITDSTASSTTPANIDVSSLMIQAVYGGQSKTLTLQPLGENTPGQFIAPITPTRAGGYTIHLGGSIGSVTFNNDVQPEEVQTADLVQFPPAATSNSQPNIALWFGIAGLALAAIATGLGVFSLNRKLSRG